MLVFRPKIVDALAGYNAGRFWADAGAGLTVGILALPLAMAFAIASGLKPEAGIFTAIIAGALISLLGGSKVQIGGPAGAFIVIVYGIVQRYGVEGLALATTMAGILLLAMGLLRLGALVRFIPIAVVIGFTNGIAVLIALSQVKDFLGLSIAHMPADFLGITRALWQAVPATNGQALALSAACLALLFAWNLGLRRLSPAMPLARRLVRVPGAVLVLVLATLACPLLGLQVETIGSRFGGIPATLPSLTPFALSADLVRALLPSAATLAMLGAIESLLCARVADSLIRERHDPNQELLAQGIANLVAPFFGGMPATGTIARTVANIGAGGRSPVAGLVHAAVLLAAILVGAPLARAVPLPALAAILMFVAWNMGEWREFARLGQYRPPYRLTLLLVFFLTVMVDLSVAVEAGLVAAGLTFIYRISSLSRGEPVPAQAHEVLARAGAPVRALRLYGALFFGAVKIVEELADALPTAVLVLDLKNLIYVDSSGAEALLALQEACARAQVRLVLCGLAHQPLDMARRCGLLARQAGEDLAPDLATGLDAAAGTTPSCPGVPG